MRRLNSSFTAAADSWIEAQRALGRRPGTLATYRSALENLQRFISRRRIRKPGLITAVHLNDWQLHLHGSGCKRATVEIFTLVVRRWFAWQVSTGLLFSSPARTLRTPKYARPQTRCPSESEMRCLLASIKGEDRCELRDRAILETAYASGARLAELSALDLSSVDLKDRSIRLFGKGQRERTVPLTRTAVRALSAYLRYGRPKFCDANRGSTGLFVGTREGRRMATPAITAVIRKYARRIGLYLTMHDIRRACATHLLAGGAHPAAVKEVLGHEGYKHLRSYLRLHPDAALNAVRHLHIFQ